MSTAIGGSLPSGFSIASTFALASAIYNTPATTDAQAVSATWSASDLGAQYIILRANAGFTSFTYAKIANNNPVTGAGNCEIGTVVSNVRMLLQAFALPGTGVRVANAVYTFEAAGYAFTVMGAAGLDVTYTDSGPVSQKGALYRYGGFATDGYIRESDIYTGVGSAGE